MPGWPVMPLAADPPPGARLALVVATGTYTDSGLRRRGPRPRMPLTWPRFSPTQALAASPLPT